MGRIFRAFKAMREGKPIGVLGFWPNRAFDARFVAPAEERLVVETFLANGAKVSSGMIDQLGSAGLSLEEVDVCDEDTVFSIYNRVMTGQLDPKGSKGSLTFLRRQVRSGLLGKAIRQTP